MGQLFVRWKASVVAGMAIAALLVASFALGTQGAARGDSLVAVVHAGDGTTYAMPLDVDDRLVVANGLGSNVIVVEGGSARMEEADCPRGDCLRQRPISRPGEQIICLPHQLWVVVAAAGDVDGATLDVDAVSWGDAGHDVGSRTDPTGDVDFVSR